MPERVLETYVRQYIQQQDAPAVTFVWQGGEPTLLGIEFFRKAVSLQAVYAGGKKIENAFQTNGVLLNDQWGEFLARNKFLVGVSIDGPAELHDVYRVDKGGKPTFSRVLGGIGLLNKHGVEFNTLTVVNRKNSFFPRDVYRFLKEIGSRYIQFIPVVERIAAEPNAQGLRLLKPSSPESTTVSDWSVEPLQYGRFLRSVFDDWVRKDVGRFFVQMFDVALESWMGMEPNLCFFARSCGSAMVLEHNGDLYSCDHFVYPENRLGNIMGQPLAVLASCKQQRNFGNAKGDTLPHECRHCGFLFACNGECPKHRFLKTASEEAGLNYLCAGYKLFFDHIEPYMRFMATELRQGKAPANVMRWVRDGEPGRQVCAVDT
jgi:uncharacterized protein